MKKLLFLLSLVCFQKAVHAQHNPDIYTIRADSVKITNDCDTAELIIENHTQNVRGFLYNKGRGRTEFKRAVKLNDLTIILGGDTLVIIGGTTASNGVGLNGRDLQIGQSTGAAGNPAALHNDREIPLNNHDLSFVGNGSIGINTTTPSNKLYVNGSIGMNKDSADLVPSISTESLLLVDTISGKYKRARPNSLYWNTSGNTGSSSQTNFIGTTDNVGLTLRTNNLPRLGIANNAMLHRMGVNGLHIYDTAAGEGGISLYAGQPARGQILFGRNGTIRTTATATIPLQVLNIGTGNAQHTTGTVTGLNIFGQLLSTDDITSRTYNSVMISGPIHVGSIGNTIARGLYINQTINFANDYRALEVEKGKAVFKDTVVMPNVIPKSDTAEYKPVVIDASGNTFKMTSWPITRDATVKRTPISDVGYGAQTTDYMISYTSLTGPRTVTLPAASNMTDRVIIIKDESGAAATHNVTINVTAGGTIDGASSITISNNFGTVEVYSSGLHWFTK